MQTVTRLLAAVANATLLPLVALLLIFEEWGWEPLTRLFDRLTRLPLWGRVEHAIRSLPPYAALATFFVPMLALFPVKLLALYWISEGDALLGISVVVLAKILGTAVVARLFHLTHPALMRLPWFARLYLRWKSWKDGFIAGYKGTAVWQAGHRLMARVRSAGARAAAAIRHWLA